MKRHTFDEEPNVSHPDACCDRHNELVSVPDGDASDTHKHLSQGDGRIEEVSMRTYTRSTINREAAIKAR